MDESTTTAEAAAPPTADLCEKESSGTAAAPPTETAAPARVQDSEDDEITFNFDAIRHRAEGEVRNWVLLRETGCFMCRIKSKEAHGSRICSAQSIG